MACVAHYLHVRNGAPYGQTYSRLNLEYGEDPANDSRTMTLDSVKNMLKAEKISSVIYLIVRTPDNGVDKVLTERTSHVLFKVFDHQVGKVKNSLRFRAVLGISPEPTDPTRHHMVLRIGTRPGKFEHMARCASCGDWVIAYESARNGIALKLSEHFEKCKKCVCGAVVRNDGQHAGGCTGRTTKWTPRRFKPVAGTIVKPPESDNPDGDGKHQWFCDFEAADFGKGYHEVYLVVLKSIEAESCEIFSGPKCMEEFVRRLLSTSRNSPNGSLWFHNGSGYDFNLLLPYICEAMPKNSLEVLKRGTKILTAKIKNRPVLHLRDFFLFCQTSLSRLCKDFRVPDEIAKGDFDHTKIKTWEDVEQHIQEATDYCRNDVLALEDVFKKFSTAMRKIAPVHVHSSITIAGHAYSVWKNITPKEILDNIHVPQKEDYEDLRKCYFGGRVLPTLARYDSSLDVVQDDFDEDGLFNRVDDFARNLDYLVMVDVVSLYPSVMMDEDMPFGPMTKTVYTRGGRSETALLLMLNGDLKNKKDYMFRGCFKVDVTCPNDHYIAYLMEKDEEGNNVQTLNPKKETWYAGPDLWEATRLGYTITRVHESMVWRERKNVFKEYITRLFELKDRHKEDKTNALYQCAKYLMNSLSGKFGQKDTDNECHLLKEFDEAFVERMLPRLIDFQLLEKEGNVEGYLVNLRKDTEERKHATQLSVFILAHARRKMSKMLSSVNGYKSPTDCLLYTDTDSLIVRKSTFDKFPAKYLGGKLGQLENEFPAAQIITARFLAPKTYTLTLLEQTSEGILMKIKTRCKGIPHRGDVFETRSFTDEDWLDNFDAQAEVDLKKRWYFVTHEDGSQQYVPYLDSCEYEHALVGSANVEVVYGSMVRNFRDDGVSNLFRIRTDYRLRALCVDCWWNKGRRVIEDSNRDIRKTTLCVGQLSPDFLTEWQQQIAVYVHERIEMNDQEPEEEPEEEPIEWGMWIE